MRWLAWTIEICLIPCMITRYINLYTVNRTGLTLNLLRDAKQATRMMHLEAFTGSIKLGILTALDTWDSGDEELIREYWTPPEL